MNKIKILGMGLVVTFLSCTVKFNVPYYSDIGLDTRILVKTSIKVQLPEKIPSVISRKSVVRTITNDLVYNVFPYFVKADADILCFVDVNRLDVGQEPWGLLWLPLVYLGAPHTKIKGMADISLKITYPDGTIIKSYRETSYKEDWLGLYTKKYHSANPIAVRTKEVLKETMEKIKKEINQDRNVIIAAIEGREKTYKVSRPESINESPELTFDYSLTDENGDKILEGGEKITLIVRVKNQGRKVAQGVRVLISTNNKALNFDRERYVGYIPPKGEKEAIFETILPNQIESGDGIILIKVTEAQGFGALEEKTLWVTMQPAK